MRSHTLNGTEITRQHAKNIEKHLVLTRARNRLVLLPLLAFLALFDFLVLNHFLCQLRQLGGRGGPGGVKALYRTSMDSLDHRQELRRWTGGNQQPAAGAIRL